VSATQIIASQREGEWERNNKTQNSPPKLLFVQHTLFTREIQRRVQDLIYKVCERVLWIFCDRGGDVDILISFLDEIFVSEGKFQGVPVLFSVDMAGS